MLSYALNTKLCIIIINLIIYLFIYLPCHLIRGLNVYSVLCNDSISIKSINNMECRLLICR